MNKDKDSFIILLQFFTLNLLNLCFTFFSLLALSNSQGEFILNGQFQVSVFHREIRVRGSILEYSGSDSVVERINSSKPLLEDLYLHVWTTSTPSFITSSNGKENFCVCVQVLAVGQLKPPDINWEFVVLDDPQAIAHRSEYSWKLSDQWTECSRPCHGRRAFKYKIL